MSMRHTKRAAEIIKSVKYATLATVTPEGAPWNSPVAHNYDAQLNIFWFSDKEGQHSKNVRNNKRVFVVMYDSTVPYGNGEGVYIQASVTELCDPQEISYACRLKKGPDYDAPDDFMGDAVRRVYKATPERVWMNDAEMQGQKFIRDYRVEIPLDELRALLANQ